MLHSHKRSEAVPGIVHEVLRTPGQPLDTTTRARMEPRLAHDFTRLPASSGLSVVAANDPSEREASVETAASGRRQPLDDDRGRPSLHSVRLHTGPRAAQSAAMLDARAYTVGKDIVFGSDEYAPSTHDGQRLLAHELAHTVQQADGGLAVQRDTIGDVQKKLSRAWNDWAITDSDALEALALLGTIDPAQLPAELQRLGPKFADRLLDNLPESAKTGDVYQRVIRALGPAGVMGYAKEQLTTSFFGFDWAVTDAEVGRVYNLMANLPEAQREDFFAQLRAQKKFGKLIDNSNDGHLALYILPWMRTLTKGALTPPQTDLLRDIVENTKHVDTLKLAMELRFNVKVGPSTSPRYPAVTELDPRKLRQTYLTLERLPDAHVAHNRALTMIGQFSLEPKKVSETQTQTVAGVYRGNQLLVNVKAESDVEGTIIHETGHAVAAAMGWSASAEPAKPERGGWKQYQANHNLVAADMAADSAGGIATKLTAPQQTDVFTQMASAMANRSVAKLKDDVRGLPWFGALPAPDRRAVLNDRALTAIGIGLEQPFFKYPDTGGEHLGAHVYHEGYTPSWVRYEHAARARKVSDYQFRDEGEWFAEAYRFYYEPDDRGRGAKLNDKDPNTKTYFDTNVHTRANTR